MGQSFMPDFGQADIIKAYPWLYTPILPLVFGAELSYMEQMAKLHTKVNELIKNDTTVNENFAKLVQAFEQWEEYLNTSTVVDGSITSAKLADNAVTQPKLANASVASRAIRDGSVLEQHLAANSVNTFALIAACVTAEKLHANAVTEDKINDGAVTGNKMADGSITLSKLGTTMHAQWETFIRVIAALENGNGDFDTNTLNVRNALTLAAQCVVNCGTAILHNLGEPVSDTDAATKKYVDNAVKDVSVGALSITSEKLATAAVTAPKIAEGAVTSAKLDSAGVALPEGSTGTTYDGQRVHSLDGTTLATLGTMASFVAWALTAGTRSATFTNLSLNGNFALNKAGTVDFNNNQLHRVADPTSSQDAATKKYVDDQVAYLEDLIKS